MKKLKGLSIIFIIMLFFSINYSYGYYHSFSNYNIEIPDRYTEYIVAEKENSYFATKDLSGGIYIGSEIAEKPDNLPLKYNSESLQYVKYLFEQSFRENLGKVPKIISEEVTTISKHRYKCFHLEYSLTNFGFNRIRRYIFFAF